MKNPFPDRQTPSDIEIANYRELTMSSGPIPDPERLAGYERVLPGAAERIFKSFEEENQHRRSLEKRIVHAETHQTIASTYAATLLLASLITLGGILIFFGKSTEGLASIVTAAGTALGTFIAKAIALRRQGKDKSPTTNE